MITADTVNRVVGFSGHGLPVVSLYARVPVEPRARGARVRSQVDSMLHEIRSMAEDRQLDHDIRMSTRGDIDRITNVAEAERWQPGAVALFSCSGRDFFEEIPLPRGVGDRIVVDETPWIRAMLAVLDEYHRCCVAVVDRQSARIWELYRDEIREIDTIRADAASRGNQDKAEELTKRHFRHVATTLDKLCRESELELLAVGGHHADVPRFLDFLTHDVRPRLACTFTVDDDSRFGLGEIKREAEAIVDRYERAQEKRMVAEAVETAAAGGLAVLGLPDCLWAGSVAGVDTLLVQDGTVAPGVICDNDRWLAPAGDTCRLCGRPVRRAPDIVDELVEAVLDQGRSIEHVSAETPLAEHLTAATLRFPLPPRE